MSEKYDSRTIWFHWATALFIFCLWGLGQSIDFFPKGIPRIGARSLHITLGVVLTSIFVARVYWRLTSGVKFLEPTPSLQTLLAKAMYFLLYLVITSVLLLGITAVWTRGDNIFGLIQISKFPTRHADLPEDMVDFHGLMANILFLISLIHASFGLWHHFHLKDHLLRRILPN